MIDWPTQHTYPVRVYYEDTDAGGVVYHSNYLQFAERARTEMLRASGVDHITLFRVNGLLFAVRSCEVEFIKPAHLDNLLEIRSRCFKITGASIWLKQLIQYSGETLVDLKLRLVCLKSDGRPGRLPRALRSAFGMPVDPIIT